MRTCPQYTNHVEDRLIDQIDWTRALEPEATIWIADHAQLRFEEQNEMRRLRAVAFRKSEVAR